MDPLPSENTPNTRKNVNAYDQTWSRVKVDPEREISTAICKALKEERERQKISQQRLSEKADISRTGLRHIESLEITPTLFTVLKVATALKVKISDLLKELER